MTANPQAAESTTNSPNEPERSPVNSIDVLGQLEERLASAGDSRHLLELLHEHLPDSRLLHAVESLHAECEQTQAEVREQERLANAGELAGVVSHEFTNFLNLLLLQVSVLEYQVPDEGRADLAEVRRQGNLAAELVRQFQQYRRGQVPSPRLVDLNAAVSCVAAELTEESLAESVPIRLNLTPELRPLRSTRPAVQRLLRFLIGNAMRAAAEAKTKQVAVRTLMGESKVVLEVEDSGAAVADEELPHVFDPLHEGREGVDVLELAACRSIVRRLDGSIRAERRLRGGGLRIIVELPVPTNGASS